MSLRPTESTRTATLAPYPTLVLSPRRVADQPAIAACNGRGTVTMSRNIDLNAVLSELGPRVAAGAAAHDADDSFVTENYRALRTAKVFSAQVPTDLGGSSAGDRKSVG